MFGLFSRPVYHDPAAPALELEAVSVRYDGTPALENVSLQVRRGDQVACADHPQTGIANQRIGHFRGIERRRKVG